MFFATSINENTFFKIELLDGIAKRVEITKTEFEAESQQTSLTTCYVFPGLIDLQVNGYNGVDMSDSNLSTERMERFCLDLASLGVTGFLPTITTNGRTELIRSLENLSILARKCELFRSMNLGIHLEGPYISPDDGPRGAHPKQFCRPPEISEFESFQKAANGQIRILTLSPEFEQSTDFIRQIADDVVVSIGHTAATHQQIRKAVEAGAKMSTHLGNGMHPNVPRHPNYLWEQLAADELFGGMIADGVHLPDSTLKTFVRAKTLDNCFLVSDTTSLSGMPPGLYENSGLGNVEVTDDQRLVVAGQRILNAGAYKPLKSAIPIVSHAVGLSFSDSMKLVCENPLDAIEAEPNPSNYVVFTRSRTGEIEIQLNVINDRPVHLKSPP